jgi:hypothetical protein
MDLAGNVYVADTFNDTIREVTPAGVVTTRAGLASAIGSTDGTGSSARFNRPVGVAVDNVGNVYVADALNQTIREITPAGAVTTLAGAIGATGSADGAGSAAQFNLPLGVAVDGVGTVYVADAQNDTVRRLSVASIAIPSSVSGPSAVAANAGLMGLVVGTTYFFRVVATSAAGGAEGAILSLTTSGVTSTATSPVTITALKVTRANVGPKGHGPKALALDVQFSGPLDAAAAQNLAAYTVFAGHVKKGHKGSASQVVYSTPVRMAQAIYSPSANSVMLLPRGKPKLTQLEQLHVNASIVTDPMGRPINNGKNFTATAGGAGVVISADAY